ncbi:MAG: aldehyde dehydrogenase [Saprospiraceae bacterium]|uniref:Aldehyde dehydrogenase n=1 Tax=Candidatus Opimibacter skivensis TaxID=2982028 RepID=A0A9D7SWA5_9BACT|nr:aldehyde dehydrogenase [Candidatus Opimibacter skivensis]
MHYDETIKLQRHFFYTNETRSIDFRIDQLKKLKSILHLCETFLYEAIYTDFKKSEFDTYSTELSFIYREIDEAIHHLPEWSGHQRAKTNIINLPGRSYIIPEPLGVCLIIGAWNYPYLLSLLPLVSAMAAGNTIILKPSEIPSSTSALIAEMINVNFDPGYLFAVEGGAMETTELLNQKFDKIFFTGSTAVGKIVYQAAAKNLTPVTLELGGKSPAIITKDSNLKDSAKRIVWSKFLNAGQTCISPDYILIDVSVKEKFLIHLRDYIQKFDYSFENKNYVQIINDRNFQRLVGLLDKTKVYFGGESDAETRYIAPTILTGVSFDDPIMTEEIFGPLLPVIVYSDLDDVIHSINSRPKPLACYIFTNDHEIRDKLLSEISFGGGAVNDTMMQISNHHLPFGGTGDSGMGSYHGKAGFATFSHFKSIVDKPFWFEPKIKYPPYGTTKLAWIKWLMKL